MVDVPEGRTVKPGCCLWRLKALALLGRDSVEDESIRLCLVAHRTGELTQVVSSSRSSVSG